MTLPNLAGVATKDLVETIGSGSFKASYINWSRTMQLLRENAPGWMVDYEPSADGLLHRAPVGGYLMVCFRHVDGTVTPAIPQAVMDHKNNAIPFDRITARDISDTQRRGMCMAAAMTFGLAYELWAKMPLESGFATGDSAPEPAPTAAPKVAPKSVQRAIAQQAVAAAKEAAPATTGGTSEASEATFREAALAKGVDTRAIDAIVEKLGGKWEAGLKTLASKTAEELNAKYAPVDEGEQW